MGRAGIGDADAQRQPLPAVYRGGRALAAARAVFAPGSGNESTCDRARVEAAGIGKGRRRARVAASRTEISKIARAARPFAGASGAGNQGVGGISKRAGAWSNALVG